MAPQNPVKKEKRGRSLDFSLGANVQELVGKPLASLFWNKDGLDDAQLSFVIDDKWNRAYSTGSSLTRAQFEKMVRGWFVKHLCLYKQYQAIEKDRGAVSPESAVAESSKPVPAFLRALLDIIKWLFEPAANKTERRYTRSLSQCISANGLLVTAKRTSRALQHPRRHYI